MTRGKYEERLADIRYVFAFPLLFFFLLSIDKSANIDHHSFYYYYYFIYIIILTHVTQEDLMTALQLNETWNFDYMS